MKMLRRAMFAVFAACACVIAAPSAVQAKTWRIELNADAEGALRTALAEAQPGDSIRLDRGEYQLSAPLSLTATEISIRGEGEDRTILTIANPGATTPALDIRGAQIELRDFAILNTPGSGIQAQDCRDLEFRDMRIEWTRGPQAGNGDYGLAIVNCDNVLINGVVARAAAKAGIYVSGSRNVIVRNASAEFNNVGVRIENTNHADLYSNTITDNAVGVAIANLPGLSQADGGAVRVFENHIAGNNTQSFTPASEIGVAGLSGVGALVMAARDVHIFGNDFTNNGAVHIYISAFPGSIEDVSYNPIARDIMVRDNDFGLVGFEPPALFAPLVQANIRFPDVMWDGADTYFAGGMPRSIPVRIVMRDNDDERDGIGAFLSLQLSVPGAPLSEAYPNPAYPPLVDIEEPERVRLN